MESVIISSENVKPSSPTPQNLRAYKFSMLDQVSPHMLVPIVLYFPNNTMEISDLDLFTCQTTQLVRRSLSVILTRFYPLAGRVSRDGKSIDCNDEGVPFVVVKFSGQKLPDLLRNPDPNLPRCLLPCETKLDINQGPVSSVALIQVNYFHCGGIAIGSVFWHTAVDGMTIATFLKSWAAATRGSGEPVCPNYIAQSMFPLKEEIPRLFDSPPDIAKVGKSVMKRYVFDTSAMSLLKSKSGIEHPTRVEVVSALMWKCFMVASLANGNSVSLVTQPVNLRRRAQPPFPSDCFGNIMAFAVATCRNENDMDLGDLVREMRHAIKFFDDDFINTMLGGEGLSHYYEYIMRRVSRVPEGVHVDVFSISSWCSFGLYSTDFGWGKPIWLTRCDTGNDSESPISNEIWFMDTRTCDGIEAWVILDEEYMSVFDNVEELRALASCDPSPFDISNS